MRIAIRNRWGHSHLQKLMRVSCGYDMELLVLHHSSLQHAPHPLALLDVGLNLMVNFDAPRQPRVSLQLLDLVLLLFQLVLQIPVLLLQRRHKVGLKERCTLIHTGEGGGGLRDVQLHVILCDCLDAILVNLYAEDLDVLVPAIDFLLHEGKLGLQPHVLIPEDVELDFYRSGLVL